MSNQRPVTLPCPHCQALNRIDLARVQSGPKCGKCGRSIDVAHPIAVGDRNLERVLGDASVPVLVDFYADWCGPCRMMAPVLETIASARAGEALVVKVDTEQNPGASARFRIGALPTLVAFRSGREVAREVGAVPRPRLEALLDTAASR